jgi:hypothetical protein
MDVIDGIEAEARTIATDGPESDGTLEWQETTIVLARVHAGGETGVGYTYEQRLAGMVRDAPPDALLVADGFSCKTQIEQLGGRRAQHLAQVIREAP